MKKKEWNKIYKNTLQIMFYDKNNINKQSLKIIN